MDKMSQTRVRHRGRTEYRLAQGIALILSVAGWFGCSVLADSLPYEHHMPTRKTDVASVEILPNYPEKSYVEVAKVEARATSMWTSWYTLRHALREEAARIGADAIVNVKPADDPDDRIKLTGVEWLDDILKPPRHATGIAIRYLGPPDPARLGASPS